MIKDILEDRESAQMTGPWLLGFPNQGSEGTIIKEIIAINFLFILLFVIYETTSTALTTTIKFRTDHPSGIAEPTKEHEDILISHGSEESEATGEEYKSMTFALMVCTEVLAY